jgi:ABC-type spermidine/putrescine transport system permease subunit II
MTSIGLTARHSLLARWNGQSFLLAGVVALVLYLVVVPLLFLLWSSFRSAPIGFPSELTLKNYANAYGDPRTYSVFGTTVVFAVSAALIALSFGSSSPGCSSAPTCRAKKRFTP